MRSRLTSLLAMSALLTGCSFAPAYHVPQSAPTPEQYKEQDGEHAGWKVAQPQDSQPRGPWWTLFNDPQLNDLEGKLENANLSLQAAFARLQQARAQYRIARADLFPSLTASSSATRERFSSNAPRFLPGFPTTYNDFVLGADLSYEVDLWGRVRNEVAAAKATQQASAADLAATDLSLRAELAEDYFDLRTDDAAVQVLDQTVEEYRKALELTANLFSGGAAALTDVAQAQAQLQTALTQAADMRLQRAQAEHAIALLIGANPSSFSLAANPLPLDVVPPPLDPGLPSELLERRPDVAEAERRVASANAQIGQARAAYFPQFTLSAVAGFESVSTATWIKAPSRFWSVGPHVSLPLFEGGRLVAQTDQAKAAYAEQVANYRNTVLGAYRDVEDNLVALRQLQAESETAAGAVTATGTVLQQAQDRYKAGIATYLEVASAETAALQAQLTVVNIQTRRMNASVLLVKALGGGWQAPWPALGKQ
jgi:NodT family efflux transporter outer membrane factor (OMF) lipoprotein